MRSSIPDPASVERQDHRVDIAVVSPGLPSSVGGVELVVSQLARVYGSRGHHVTILAQRPRGRTDSDAASVSSVNVEVESFPDWLGSAHFAMAPGLWRRLRSGSGRWGIVHAHSFHASAAMAASLLTSDPLVFSPHYHGTGHTAAARILHRVYDPLATRIFSRADLVVCVSQAEADALVRDYRSLATKIEIVHNGVDLDSITESEPYDVDFIPIMMAGRLEKYKGIDTVIKAMPAVPNEMRLVIAGDGIDRNRLQDLAGSLRLGERVSFLGRVPTDQLRRWQRSAQVTLSLSEHEAFGLTLLEGIAAGSAVIASDIPAHREVNNLTGGRITLVPAAIDPRDLADAITDAVRRRPSLPVADLQHLSWEGAGSRLLELYESLI